MVQALCVAYTNDDVTYIYDDVTYQHRLHFGTGAVVVLNVYIIDIYIDIYTHTHTHTHTYTHTHSRKRPTIKQKETYYKIKRDKA